MVEVIRDLWVCQDCLMFIANGDLTGLDNDPASADARQREIIAGCERELPYQWVCDSPATGEHAPECAYCDGTGKVAEASDCTDANSPCEHCDGRGRVDELEGADTQEFSWAACACCQSTLGGSRHRCALIKVK